MKYLIFLIIALLAVSSAAALSEDFQISSFSRESLVCSASSDITDIIQILNTGDVTSAYTVELSGGVDHLTLVGPQSLTLKPGQSAQYFLYTTSAPGTSATYEADIVVTTIIGTKKVLHKRVIVNNCANIAVSIQEQQKTVLPCEPVEYMLQVQNTGTYAEEYLFTSEYATFSVPGVILVPGDSAQVKVTVQLGCEVSGNLYIEALVTSKRGGFTAIVPLVLDIQPAYDFTVTADETFSLCAGPAATVPISIENKANFPNIYDLAITGNRWVAPAYKTVQVNGSQAASLDLEISPIRPSQSNGTLVITSKLGDLRLEKPFTLDVQACTGVVLKVPKKAALCTLTSRSLPITITNDGSEPKTVTLRVDQDFATVPESIIVDAGEIRTIDVQLSPSKTADKITITATADGLSQSKTISLTMESEDACRELIFLTDSVKVNSSSQTIRIPVQNTGLVAETYRISLDAPAWATLEQDWMELGPGDQGAIEIAINPEEEGSFKLTFQAQGEHGSSYTDILTLQVGEDTTLSFVKLYLLYIIAGIGVVLIISGVVKLRKKAARPEKSKEKN